MLGGDRRVGRRESRRQGEVGCGQRRAHRGSGDREGARELPAGRDQAAADNGESEAERGNAGMGEGDGRRQQNGRKDPGTPGPRRIGKADEPDQP